MTTRTGWQRRVEGLGVWEHRGKVAIAGVGHSPTDRRWDGKTLETSLGAYSIIAAQKAIEESGVNPDDIDGVITCPEAMGENWAPRPYFEAPYDSEDGLTLITAEWLTKQLGLKNVNYLAAAPQIGEMMGFAAQAVGDGLCNTCLVLYPTGNLEGRYHHGGENASDYAEGWRQWGVPYGYHAGALMRMTMAFGMDCRRYGRSHDGLTPFAINQRRNGLLTPWGFYTLHEPYQITAEDYLTARPIHKPLTLLDCDRPVNASACYLFTTAERARDMNNKPVYVLTHEQNNYRPRSLMPNLDEIEGYCDSLARRVWEGSGLSSEDIDVFNPYDGYLTFTQFFLEAFQWHGVKRGEAHDFYADDIRVEGPHPFLSSGGNNGTGRTRTALFTDSVEQLQGRAGERQVKIKAETALAGCNTPDSSGWIVLGTSPD